MSTATTEAPVTTTDAKKDKKDTRPAGIRVVLLRGKADPEQEAGDYAIMKSVESPWEPGALRLVRGLKAGTGKKVHIRRAKDGQWLGAYVAVKAEPGRRYSTWEVQASS